MSVWLKKIFIIAVIILVGIQFIPTKRNISKQLLETDITKSFSVPKPVQDIFKRSCYDCHSNNTNYPWYNKVQPVSWLLENHIEEGKKELNFSDFGSYSKRKQRNKLKSIISQIKDDEMPLWTYTIIHKKAKLSEKDKALIKQWAAKLLDTL
jgi:hypothetical protein